MSIWKSMVRTLTAALPLAIATTASAGAPLSSASTLAAMTAPVALTAENQPGATPAAPAAAAPAEKKDDKPKSNVMKAAVITFGDEANGNMVGVYCTAESFRRAIKPLEEEGIKTVVVRFRSGGGALIEIQKLSDVFEKEYKPRFRLVAWIDSAISAAAMSAHCFEEIYFTPQGNYGACTGFSGAGVAVKGRDLEEVLFMMEEISARGGYNPLIMRAMQISSSAEECAVLGIGEKTGALSANVDPDTGAVKYFNDSSSGNIVLNPKGGVNVLTFSAADAMKVKFSKGTAGTLDELTKAMSLTEVEWVGRKDARFVYPVCKAEEYMLSFRKKTKDDESNLNRYLNNYTAAAGAAADADAETAGKLLGKARQALEQIKSVVRNNPNLVLFQGFGSEERYKQWIEQQEKTLKEIASRIKNR